ncbi:hypothetical protein M501DRAFT_1001443 [Patellaria atrata CBS 101060]|uniref:Uncharacterized protein n=1 Tax=Patellaria atrata CBS 101060 TaxID=1346257 RepID=A0A9P4VM08_9PEZI|nr:hypothetical protein M501DRAFT_1001443 [Patellaria atrata CBS 101060]
MSWSKIPLLVQTNFINRINGILSGNGLTSWNTDIAGWRMPKVLQTTRVAILQTAPTNPVLESTPKSHESGRKFYDPVRDSSRIPDQAGESSN